MVHALEKIHRLLKPGGWLIDIHPTSEPASIEVRVGERTLPAGWLRETDDYAEYEEWLALERAAYFERKARRASKLDPLDAPVVWIRPIEIADDYIPF